jgi:serine/threonine protein kinase
VTRRIEKKLAGTPLPAKQAAALIEKLARALHAVHEKGVIHRDLKPANVILRPDGEPVITDFGLARRGDDTRGEALTRQGDVIGTIEYMSPEQFEGDNAAVGPASDVYALGVVLYELLTGRRPFTGGTASTVAAILLKPPPRPGELRPGVPTDLEEVCLKAMAKQPADRFSTMAQLASALTAFIRSHQSGVTPAASRSSAAAPTPPPSAATRPVRDTATSHRPGGGDPGWELVEDPAPASPPPPAPAPAPASVVRAKLIKPRKKKPRSNSDRIILIGGGIAAICLSLILGAIILRLGSGPGDRPTTPTTTAPPPTSPPPPPPLTVKEPEAKEPVRGKAPGESRPRSRRGTSSTPRR